MVSASRGRNRSMMHCWKPSKLRWLSSRTDIPVCLLESIMKCISWAVWHLPFLLELLVDLYDVTGMVRLGDNHLLFILEATLAMVGLVTVAMVTVLRWSSQPR